MIKVKFIYLYTFLSLLCYSCTDQVPDSRIDLDMFDPINMRVINNSEHGFSQVLIVPCFNTPEESFLNVNPSDTTAYRAYKCGFVETIVEVILQEDNSSFRHESLDFVTPLSSGNYDCFIQISDKQELIVQINLSEM